MYGFVQSISKDAHVSNQLLGQQEDIYVFVETGGCVTEGICEKNI